jgi:hypothetical protein
MPFEEDDRNSDLILKPESETSDLSATPSEAWRYVDPAPMDDVMFDQLEYLLTHQRGACRARCQDCLRLRHVERWLLRPFRGNTYGQTPAGNPAQRNL